MGALSELPNIGRNNEAQLNQVGIFTAEELIQIGSKQAWLKIKAIDPSACINRLYALEGAIQNINKKYLPQEKKEELKEFFHQFKN